jgi:mannose-6-phosphate isomerase-like protein (cupin superfamily)
MLVKDIQKCPYFTAGDGSILCELLHPLREEGDVALHCSIAHARLPAGQNTIPHKLKKSAEVYYILEGKGIMHVNGKSAEVLPGRAVYVPPGAVQYLENTGDQDLFFLCIVDPMWRQENEEIVTDNT